MERTVPSTGSEDIELYQRTYYSLLRTTDEVPIRSLVESHARMESALHIHAGDSKIDLDAMIYASIRLPPCIRNVRLVVMSPSEQAIREQGYDDVGDWQPAVAPGRRRRTVFNGEDILAAYIASRSDIDDLIPILTAYQIEWNKIYHRLHDTPLVDQLEAAAEDPANNGDDQRQMLCRLLELSGEELNRLETAWGEQFFATMAAMGSREKQLAVRLISGSYVDYRRATRYWWEHIAESIPTRLSGRAVYFVSSNTHSLINLLGGCALRREEELTAFIEQGEDPDLLAEYHAIREDRVPSRWENLLYFAFKDYQQTPEGQRVIQECREELASSGIWHIPSLHFLDVDAQVIELCALRPEWFDPRIRIDGLELLRDSDALLLNIDYPLGLAAYRILTQVTTGIDALHGLYVLGKAATLNGRVGDVMIPDVIHDEHSQNTYLFDNVFSYGDLRPFLIYGTVLDNQKAISVRGTFLQNRQYMDVFYREGFTDLEMEAGPYLSSTYEAIRPKRYPFNEIVNLYAAPFEIGIMHYASDTPFTRGKMLGERLSYHGIDATYACSVAILRRILEREVAAVQKQAAVR